MDKSMESPSSSTPYTNQRHTSPMSDAGELLENEEYKNEPSPLQQLENDLITYLYSLIDDSNIGSI